MDVYDKSFFDYSNKKFAECFTLRKKLFPAQSKFFLVSDC